MDSKKKSDLSGAIVNVGVDKLEDVASPNLVSALGGRLAGVYVQQNGGGPNPYNFYPNQRYRNLEYGQ